MLLWLKTISPHVSLLDAQESSRPAFRGSIHQPLLGVPRGKDHRHAQEQEPDFERIVDCALTALSKHY